MSKGRKRNLEEGFSGFEKRIVEDFLDGKSIRELVNMIAQNGNKGRRMGRTAIKNLLMEYAKCYPEYKEEINNRLFQNRTHKTTEEAEISDLPRSVIEYLYYQIINSQKTLTEISLEYGRTRDYIKRRIIEFLPEEKQDEFLGRLKENQNSNSDELYKLYESLPDNEKKDIIFEKINERRKKAGKKPYTIDLLERKLKRIQHYFLVTRNEKIKESRNMLISRGVLEDAL